ncbi:anticodon-binding aminoacyl-tRNA synthetase, class 1a, partial [Tanacetum coccineum]
MHVSDVGQRDDIELCITVAKSLGLTVNKDPLSHVVFGSIQVEDYERFRTSSKAVNFLNLLDEAKSRCREVLDGRGKANKWTTRQLEHTAEALGYGAV